MFSQDISLILIWWFVFFFIGILFLPLTQLIFSQFFDRGYIFSKILGLLFLTYAVFLLGTLKILPFTYMAIMFLIFVWGAILVWFLIKAKQKLGDKLSTLPWKIFLFEEFLFLAGLLFWSYIRVHEPSIHGLEKYMDFGFVSSILNTDYFPAKDLWLTPFTINYYYFGHIMAAVLTKLSGIDPAVTYNLMIATLFAFTFTSAFSIGANLISQFKVQSSKFKVIMGGLLAGFVVALAGNLHTIYAFFNAYDGENPVPFWTLGLDFNLTNYWYPNATRFIQYTIHEFPLYSFVVSDLHGHVISIPIVLTIIAILLSVFMKKEIKIYTLVLIAFLLSTAYMTNAWDGLIYFLLTALVILYITFQKNFLPSSTAKVKSEKLKVKSYNAKLKIFHISIPYFILHASYVMLLLGTGFILFSMPFSLFFKPFVSGIGVICAPEFLTKMGSLGPFLFEANHCQKSPLWQMIILHGFWYFWAFAFVGYLYIAKRTTRTDMFVLLLITLSTLLLILPEFIYMKDIYPGHYRANTMFKLGYQAFMMLGIATTYIIIRLVSNFKHQLSNLGRFSWKLGIILPLGFIGLMLIGIYPYFAIDSYYGQLKDYNGLDGLAYLRDQYSADYEAILWIRNNIEGQPVMLEAVGESYTDFARVSANTGLPTVVGWPVHEWLWRGSYDEAGKRTGEVELIYTTTDPQEAKGLLDTYKVQYVFVGILERQKYPNLDEVKFSTLGTPVYQNDQTVIYKIYN